MRKPHLLRSFAIYGRHKRHNLWEIGSCQETRRLSSLDLSNDLSTKLAQLAKPAGMEVGELRVFESH